MPANSSVFNKYFSLPAVLLWSAVHASAQIPDLDQTQLQWLGERIYQNECNGRTECLTSWNPGENFPSLGIGHFIWFRSGQVEAYTETFPELLDFYQRAGISLPAWLAESPQRDSPWPDRATFYSEIDGERLRSLRQFLSQTQAVQVAFIVQRMQLALPRLLAAAAPTERDAMGDLFHRVANSRPPHGMYALIDYIHFKGEGISPTERYNGQGWGLLQVLQTLYTQEQQSVSSDQQILAGFADAAAAVLRQRVANAPPERNEQRWLEGWLKRVAGYDPDAL
ncbi:MAG: hypothetical protein RLZZ385_1075 [Pseudomonadota bacterium]|jgi:hypothetical protein